MKAMLNGIKIYLPVLFVCLMISCSKEVSVSPEEEPVSTGFIQLESSPANAKIYLNGTYTGKVTPDSIRFLDDGDYKILLRLSGWKDTVFTVNISDGEKKDLYINFKVNPAMYGSILITSSPTGASISINDSATGQVTPATLSNLLPGTYNIELQKTNCQNDLFEAEVESGTITRVNRVLADTSYWVVYKSKNSSLPSNTILSIAIDNEDAKWIGTNGNGVAVLKGNDWTIYNKSNSPLPDNRVQTILIDNQNNKWFGTTNYGLVKFDGTNWTIYNTSNSSIPGNNIVSIVQDKNDKIWISAYSYGIASLENESFVVYNTNSGLPTNYINSILISNSNEVWVGSYLKGIAVYRSGVWKVYNQENSGINNNITVLIKDNDGVIYAGTYGSGVVKLDNNTWKFISPTFAVNILAIAVDKNNYIWVGSNDNGLSLIQGIFTYRDVFNESTSPIDVGVINAIAVDKYNYKWIGTAGGGLYKYKGKL